MNKRRQLLKGLFMGGAASIMSVPTRLLGAGKSPSKDVNIDGSDLERELLQNGERDREYWASLLYKMCKPVLSNLANDSLKENMVVKKSPTYDNRSISVTYLEAVGRSLAGVAPWLALPDDDTKESQMRQELRSYAIAGLTHAVNPNSKDYLNFRTDMQPIVDTAYLAQSFIRAPKALWEPLDDITKQRVVTEFKALRDRKPFNNNWVIFG